MPFKLPPLPYPRNALEPCISAETLHYHHDKHHKAYVQTLNKLIEGTPLDGKSLEEIIRTEKGKIYNQAAQAWNHDFYWKCMTPPKRARGPEGALFSKIQDHFGDLKSFQNAFSEAAKNEFGSGWAWLVQNPDGSLAVLSSDDADNPLSRGQKPLLTCDVWEHSYYIDYRNERPKYIKAFWKVINWEFVEQNLEAASSRE